MKKMLFLLGMIVLLPISLFISFLWNPYFIQSFFVRVIILSSVIFVSCLVMITYYYLHNWIYKVLFVTEFLCVSALIIASILQYYQLMYIFSSITNLKIFILSTGKKGMIVYILIQMAQVIFLPIPAGIITLAGVAIWGPLWGGVLDSIGVLLGSYVSFCLGKIFGFKLVSWIVGYQNATKYASIINDRGKFFLFYAFLLPLFPDDILCLIAGITTMSFQYFFFVALITRPIGVICMCYFGGGYIIPFQGWGIYVWIALAIIILFSIYYLTKNQEKIEKKVLNWLPHKHNKKHVP